MHITDHPTFNRFTVSRSGRIKAKKSYNRSATFMDTSDFDHITHRDVSSNEKDSTMQRTSSNEENVVPLSEHATAAENSKEGPHKDDFQRPKSVQSASVVNNLLSGQHLTPSRKRNSDCDNLDIYTLQRSSNICNGNEDYSLQEVRSKIAKYQLDKDESVIDEVSRVTSKNPTNHEKQSIPRKSFVTKLSIKNSKKVLDPEDKSPDCSFEDMLKNKATLQAFREFLQSEYSEENLDFWLECEQFKLLKGAKLERAAFKIFAQYMARSALREVNIDSSIRSRTQERLKSPDKDCFVEAQNCIYTLMRSDPFRRFILSDRYQKLSESNEGFKLMLKRSSTKKK